MRNDFSLRCHTFTAPGMIVAYVLQVQSDSGIASNHGSLVEQFDQELTGLSSTSPNNLKSINWNPAILSLLTGFIFNAR